MTVTILEKLSGRDLQETVSLKIVITITMQSKQMLMYTVKRSIFLMRI